MRLPAAGDVRSQAGQNRKSESIGKKEKPDPEPKLATATNSLLANG
jgi:hypothetical protein